MILKQLSPFLVILMMAGCAQMLPCGSSEGPSSIDSFEAAAAAFDKIVSHQTTVEELEVLGFDLHASSNLTLIPYPLLTARLSSDPGMRFETLDAGIRECILSHQACLAYEFHLGRETTHHEGGFFTDFLNFRRSERVVGWRLNGGVAVPDGVVLSERWWQTAKRPDATSGEPPRAVAASRRGRGRADRALPTARSRLPLRT